MTTRICVLLLCWVVRDWVALIRQTVIKVLFILGFLEPGMKPAVSEVLSAWSFWFPRPPSMPLPLASAHWFSPWETTSLCMQVQYWCYCFWQQWWTWALDLANQSTASLLIAIGSGKVTWPSQSQCVATLGHLRSPVFPLSSGLREWCDIGDVILLM